MKTIYNNEFGTTTEELFTYGDGNTLALRVKNTFRHQDHYGQDHEDQLPDEVFIVTNWEVDYSNVVEADRAITITLEVVAEASYLADDFSEVSERYISIGFSELINLYNKG